MTITENAEAALDSSRGTIDALMRWFEANRDDLPVGIAVAAGIVAVMLVLRWIGGMMAASDPHCTRWRGIIGRVLSKTGIVFMVAAAVDIVVTYAAVPSRIGRLADIFFIIAFALQGAIWARELILGVIGRRAGDDVGDSNLANAMTIIRVLVSVALFAIALIVILDNLGVNVTALVAGFGIGGIAIGLAAQGIFSDLFAALAILFDRPFRRGDTIRYGQSTGTVEKIGLKTTRLRSLDGQQLVMANTKLLEQEIHNYAAGHSRRTTLTFGLVYQTSPDMLERVPELARSVVTDRSGCVLVRCAITAFGASSIDFELIFDSATTDPDVVGADRTAIVPNLMRVFATQGIEFAYPTQTTFTAAPDGTYVLPYAARGPAKR
ncbi:MAG TPA: mechanosensitive ion channel domain-containing protein [Sphingomicrobium sp.]|nr:mechanosensitive ion channel domain-containing protein [Sphingomicrobium sp.]